MTQPLLTSKPRVKLLLQREEADTSMDAVLDFLIEAASEKVRAFTGRRFTSPAGLQTREVALRDSGAIYIDEVFSAGSIVSVTGPAGISEPYRFVPERYPVKGGWLHLDATPGRSVEMYPRDHLDFFTTEIRGPVASRRPGDTIQVTAYYGYPAIPASLDYEAARLVQEWFDSDVADYSTSFDANQGRFIVPEELPSAVQKSLEKWKIPEGVLVG